MPFEFDSKWAKVDEAWGEMGGKSRASLASKSGSLRSKGSAGRKKASRLSALSAVASGVTADSPKPVTLPAVFDESSAEYMALPRLVRDVVKFFSTDGRLQVDGIFRQSAQAKRLADVHKRYRKNKKVSLHKESPYLAAALLKLYFRELKTPLLSAGENALLRSAAQGKGSERLQRVAVAVRELPAETLFLLRFVFAFLVHVCANAGENRMGVENVAIVFGPSLFPDLGYGSGGNLVHCCIKHYSEVFE